MEEKSYPFSVITNEYKYEFLSISETKQVKKVVLFTKVSQESVYNLALLDELENGELSDNTETNNNDLQTVLSTIIHIIEDFLIKNKESIIVFRSDDKRRQRLYRIVVII